MQIPSISSGVYYTYINPIIYVAYKIIFCLDPIKIWNICLDHSNFRMMRKLLSILLVTTSIWTTKFLEEIQEHTCDSICHLWIIMILCNAHLCIYNVVLTMCLTHKVPQNLPNSLLKFFNLEEMILNTGSNPFIWKYLVSMDYIIKYLMFIHIMAKLNLSLRELSLLFDDLK